MSVSRRPLVLRIAVLVTLVGLLAGCVSREDNSAAKEAPATVPLSDLAGLTLEVGDQKGGTESLLRAAGALDGLPYKIAFSTFTSGPPQIEAATAGKIDFAITGNTPPIFGAASNAKVKVVSAYDGSGRGDRILVQTDSPIRAVTDLRGKRIAVGKGSSAHGNVLAQLTARGSRRRMSRWSFCNPPTRWAHSRSGRSTRGRSGIRTPRRPKLTSRFAASPRRQASPTARASVSHPTRRSPIPNATPH